MKNAILKTWNDLTIADDYMFCLLMNDIEVFKLSVDILLLNTLKYQLKVNSRQKIEVGLTSKSIETDEYGYDELKN